MEIVSLSRDNQKWRTRHDTLKDASFGFPFGFPLDPFWLYHRSRFRLLPSLLRASGCWSSCQKTRWYFPLKGVFTTFAPKPCSTVPFPCRLQTVWSSHWEKCNSFVVWCCSNQIPSQVDLWSEHMCMLVCIVDYIVYTFSLIPTFCCRLNIVKIPEPLSNSW